MPHIPGPAYRAIPGPSVMPEEVLRAMHRPAPNIYGGDLEVLTAGLIPDLRRVARTDGAATIYIGNGHAAWEAALANTIAPGEAVLVPCTGRFGHGWAEMAEALGAEPQILDFGKQAPVDMDRLDAALRADKTHRIKAVLATHVDTSTSVLNDIAAMRAVLDDTGHPALLMADCIASLACDRFEMDAWGVDVMVAASQKGLMVPPGLAFVFFNARAAEKRKHMPRVSRYWDWTPRADPELFYQYFCGTAPTHHLFGLRAALDMIHAEGMEAIWTRHETLAHAIWAAADAWQEGGALRLNLANPAHRSHAVTSLSLPAPKGTELRHWVEAELGVTLGIGLGMAEPGSYAADGFFRFGHMGHVNGHMIMGLLGAVEAGLTALDVPHGRGALEAAAAVLATGGGAPRSG
ncbi:alanine--glyoxylate aminotransferase family protein [Roseovarius faecimaris]|uniref:Alanine--glyoxylate aminotransferase family protein n=1 Tax=Roseovarius faecimaris TaxID=2494550 RepID=A0A6I6IUK9_9RHOB|nr:aminotransferase class V-fold PLP-dependent enzyme [Roseovarius faecimaris]QGX99187.1 alanine--glyoxylate aminotransferase family protein [Roseovarius faecimaris]